MAYHRAHGVDTHIVRIFNTYGPRMRLNDGRALPNFVYQALSGQPITVYGDGRQTRSFCYVDDLVEGLLRLMATEDAVTGPVNLGNPAEFTIRELAEKVIALAGGGSRIDARPLPQDDPRQRRPDIARAREALGCRLTRGTAVPAPVLIASDTDGEATGGWANLTTLLPGRVRLDRLGPAAIEALAGVASLVAPGGTLVLVATAWRPQHGDDGPPWPLRPEEVDLLGRSGLAFTEREVTDGEWFAQLTREGALDGRGPLR